MDKICVKLLNTPVVMKNSETIVFPFRKAEALFYYLLVKKQGTRDELVNLLWGEIDEETAKKNLRHAMYKLRKTFDMDIVISPQKSMVLLNPDIPIENDVDNFLRDEEKGVEVYKGEFLQGFSVKDGEEFESWMLQYREHLRDLYMHRLFQQIEVYSRKKNFQMVEHYSKLIIAADPFDERAYRILMETYGKEGAYHKAIDLYNRLSSTLKEELGITPDAETKGVMERVLEWRNEKAKDIRTTMEPFFYGRAKELETLKHNHRSFMASQPSKSFVIIGEAGIGKTKLKDKFIQDIHEDEVYLVESNCYQAEQEYYLKPWNDVFGKLSDIVRQENIEIPSLWKNVISYLFPIYGGESSIISINPVERVDRLKYQVAEEAVLGLFKLILQKRKILLVFDDIQWMDKISLRLLSAILLHRQESPIYLAATCRNGYSRDVDRFMTSLMKYDKMEKLILDRFTKEEIEDFVRQAMPHFPWSKEMSQKIYEETEGNTFFLVELLNTLKEKGDIGQMTPKMQDIIKSRFLDLSDEGRKLLNIASMFFDKVSLEILKALSGKDEFEILDLVEELQNKYILRELGDGDAVNFEFTHQKLRDFIYEQQSLSRRRVLHSKIAQLLEKSLRHDKRDRMLYSRLIYHYYYGGNKVQALKYRIKNLDDYLDISHEVIPLAVDGTMEKEKYTYLPHAEVVQQLEEIEDYLREVKNEAGESGEVQGLEIAFLHIKGRYFIWEGVYDKGVACIEKMIHESLVKRNYTYVLKGYRQMVNYGIQIHNISLMANYVTLGLEEARKHTLPKEVGTFLRLKGLNKIMAGAYEEAEEILKESIGVFQAINQHEDKYTLNIAAGYCYIGEIRRFNMKFSSALQYYEKAVKLCEEKNVMRGLTMFYTNAGQAALDMGDYARAKNYLLKATGLYDQLDTLWGRSTAEGYMALLMAKGGDYRNALVLLQKAVDYAEKLKSPYELGLVYRVKAEIKANMKANKGMNDVFSRYLWHDLAYYCSKGIEYLRQVGEPYEIEILNVLEKNRG
ncbi:MAG: BTAD domain-containing putative transcriptional regulator [Bacillota bacterium]